MAHVGDRKEGKEMSATISIHQKFGTSSTARVRSTDRVYFMTIDSGETEVTFFFKEHQFEGAQEIAALWNKTFTTSEEDH